MDNRSGCQNSKLEWRGPLEFKGEHEFMKTMKTSPKHRPRSARSQKLRRNIARGRNQTLFQAIVSWLLFEDKNGWGGGGYVLIRFSVKRKT